MNGAADERYLDKLGLAAKSLVDPATLPPNEQPDSKIEKSSYHAVC